MKRMKAINILVVSIIILLAMNACGLKKEEETSETLDSAAAMSVTLPPSQFDAIKITTGKIEQKQMHAVLEVNGMLDVPPQNLVTVSALMGGFIKSTDILQGMNVKKGALIATIQNPEFVTIQKDYLENKSRLKYLELEYKRQEELAKENVTSAKTFQQISSEYNSALVINGALTEKLKMIGINPANVSQNTITSVVDLRSPINGYITVVNINIGSFVNPQDIICEIVDTDHLHAELTVFEKDITKVKVGQKIVFKIVNGDAKERTAKVYLINHKIASDRTVRVHAHMDKNDPALIPNMYLKAYIYIDEQNVLAVPQKAVVQIEDEDYIFIEKNAGNKHQYEGIKVQKGISENGYTEIILPASLDYNQINVVIDGAYDLLSKLKNIEEEE